MKKEKVVSRVVITQKTKDQIRAWDKEMEIPEIK